MNTDSTDLFVELQGSVGLIEIRRPPHNYFNRDLIMRIAEALEAFDRVDACKAILLASSGKSFCAGADFSSREAPQPDGGKVERHTYKEAIRLFRTSKPIVAAVHGAAIGGGLGLAMIADFRVGCADTRFSANFTKLGIHPGFGLTVTLPRVIGIQNATMMFYTGRSIKGEEAEKMNLLDVCVPSTDVYSAALALANDIAMAAPLATVSTRETMRQGLADQVERATEREMTEQTWLMKTADFREGIAAVRDRREADFKGN